MKDIFIKQNEQARKFAQAEAEKPDNQLRISTFEIGTTFLARRPPRVGDGGLPSFGKYTVTGFGREGVIMQTAVDGTKSPVAVDFDRLMREAIIADPNMGDGQIVDIYMNTKKGSQNGNK